MVMENSHKCFQAASLLSVLFPPCAAGARPIMTSLAFISPKPHTGLDQ